MAQRLKIFITLNWVRRAMLFDKAVWFPVNTLKKVLENIDLDDVMPWLTINGYADDEYNIQIFTTWKCRRKMKIGTWNISNIDKWGEIVKNDLSFYNFITRNVSFL